MGSKEKIFFKIRSIFKDSEAIYTYKDCFENQLVDKAILIDSLLREHQRKLARLLAKGRINSVGVVEEMEKLSTGLIARLNEFDIGDSQQYEGTFGPIIIQVIKEEASRNMRTKQSRNQRRTAKRIKAKMRRRKRNAESMKEHVRKTLNANSDYKKVS